MKKYLYPIMFLLNLYLLRPPVLEIINIIVERARQSVAKTRKGQGSKNPPWHLGS